MQIQPRGKLTKTHFVHKHSDIKLQNTKSTLPLVNPNHNHSLELDFRRHKSLILKLSDLIYLEVSSFLKGSTGDP